MRKIYYFDIYCHKINEKWQKQIIKYNEFEVDNSTLKEGISNVGQLGCAIGICISDLVFITGKGFIVLWLLRRTVNPFTLVRILINPPSFYIMVYKVYDRDKISKRLSIYDDWDCNWNEINIYKSCDTFVICQDIIWILLK